jgi:hypothetical protein
MQFRSLASQAERLRKAFPTYAVDLIRCGDEIRLEAVSMVGGSPYCLISSDPEEIRRELEHAA